MRARYNLSITPKRFIPRGIFWTGFAFLSLAFLSGSLVYLDRNVWHNDFAEILPADTEFLVVVPANSADQSLQKTKELFSLVPGSRQFTDGLEPEQFLSLLPQFRPFYEFWHVNQDNLTGKLKIAGLNGGVATALSVKNADFLKNLAVVDEVYLDADILKVAGEQTEFFAWLSGRELVLSSDKKLMKNLVANKRALQFSYWGENTGDVAVEFLNQNEHYRTALAELPSDYLVAVYVNVGTSETSSYILEMVKSFFSFSSASLTQVLDPAKSKPLLFAAKAQDGGYAITTVMLPTETEPVHRTASDLLIYNFPQRLLDTEIKFMAQIKTAAFFDLPSNPLSFFDQKPWNDFISFQGLSIQRFSESWQQFENGALLLAGTSMGGRPEVFIVAKHGDRAQAEGIGESLAEGFRYFSAEADYLYQKNHLFVGTNRAALDELTAAWGSPQVSFAHKYGLNFPNESLATVFMDTNFLTQYGRYSLGSGQSSALAALEAMTTSLPSIKASFVARGDMIVQQSFFEIKAVPMAQKSEAEDYLEGLGQVNQPNNPTVTPAIRDAGRLADATILETAITQFITHKGRAPIRFGELVPTYLSGLPVDPQLGTVYQFSNSDNDKSFFVSFVFEEGEHLNGSGLYCLTSFGLEYASGGACTEK